MSEALKDQEILGSGTGSHERRRFMLAVVAGVGWACSPTQVAQSPESSSSRALAELESTIGGRLGVFALDTGTGRWIGQRRDERFAMCSTFKWALAAQVLHLVDRGELMLEERVPFGAADLLEYAPVTRSHVSEGGLSIRELGEAAVVVSDNTAANLLLSKVGGPSAFTAYLRSLGDDTTRLDRTEPMLNQNEPLDPRDTTSPSAMVHLMHRVLCEDALSEPSRQRLTRWLVVCETGLRRLRAGLPREWKAGDKTGTGNGGACNDVAIVWPSGRPPILIASYLSDSEAPLADLEAVHAELARIVAAEFASGK